MIDTPKRYCQDYLWNVVARALWLWPLVHGVPTWEQEGYSRQVDLIWRKSFVTSAEKSDFQVPTRVVEGCCLQGYLATKMTKPPQ
jgi:hypothetical protein